MKTATILEIQRMSTEDGPGIRTTVFFKGCSLNCTWCHNPESIPGHSQVHWIGNRCIGCQTCLKTCPENAIFHTEKGIKLDRTICKGGGECVEECPSTALELLGAKWDLDDLIHEVIKDKVYFDKSGGGVTISGGEPTLQPQFASEFLKLIKLKGIQTALDTCGLCSKAALKMILPHTTTILFDIKEIDTEKHQQLTGSHNKKILDNLVFVADFMQNHVHPKTLWIRTPIIPGATDNADNITGIGRFLAKYLGKTVNRWELCTFNNLCEDKYSRLDLVWQYKMQELVTENQMNYLADIAKRTGVNPDIVHWSGSTRLKETQSIPIEIKN